MAYVTVEIDMSEFSDGEIIEEYNGRELGNVELTKLSELEELTRAYMAHHAGKRDVAYDILWKMCLIKLNKVI